MSTLSLPIAAAIREDAATILTFAFSRRPLQLWGERALQGAFEQFRHTMFDLPAQRAERACLELALLLRYLDDESHLSELYQGYSSIDFGRLHHGDGTTTALDLRDVANKIIHAGHFEWNLSDDDRPFLIAISREPERWTRADISITALCVAGGSLNA